MKRALGFQMLIILIILVGWNALHIGYDIQKKIYYGDLSDKPMILISYNLTLLDSINEVAGPLDYVRSTDIENEEDVTKNLIEMYELETARDFITEYDLPNVMRIKFDADKFRYKQKTDFELIISNSEIQKNYDEEFWQKIQEKALNLKKGYLIANLVFIVFTIFFSGLIRVYFEQKSNEFWRIFRASGGYLHRRRDKFILNSGYIIFVPLLLNIATYFVLIIYEQAPLYIEYKYFAVEPITLILGMLMARAVMGKKF